MLLSLIAALSCLATPAPAPPASGALFHVLADEADVIVVARPTGPSRATVIEVIRAAAAHARPGQRLRLKDARLSKEPQLLLLRRVAAGRYERLGTVVFASSPTRPRVSPSDSGPWVRVTGWRRAGLRFPSTLSRVYAGLDGAPAACITPKEGRRHLDTETVWFELGAFRAMLRTRHTRKDYGPFRPPPCP